MQERFLVTGATGFVGRAVTSRLLQQAPVLALARRAPPANRAGLVPLEADITVPLPDVPRFRGATVVHAAAQMNSTCRADCWRTNVEGTFHALEWAARHQARHFILFSSGGVYGYGREPRTEEHAIEPIGYYGHTKKLAEEATLAYHRQIGMAVTVVRLFFPCGPDQHRGVFPLIANAVRLGTELTVHRDGCPRMNPVHVADVADAVVRMAARPDGWRVFNLCGDETVSFLDLVRRYEQHWGRAARLVPSDQDHGDLLGANARLKRELNWTPRRRLADLFPAGRGHCFPPRAAA